MPLLAPPTTTFRQPARTRSGMRFESFSPWDLTSEHDIILTQVTVSLIRLSVVRRANFARAGTNFDFPGLTSNVRPHVGPSRTLTLIDFDFDRTLTLSDFDFVRSRLTSTLIDFDPSQRHGPQPTTPTLADTRCDLVVRLLDSDGSIVGRPVLRSFLFLRSTDNLFTLHR